MTVKCLAYILKRISSYLSKSFSDVSYRVTGVSVHLRDCFRPNWGSLVSLLYLKLEQLRTFI